MATKTGDSAIDRMLDRQEREIKRLTEHQARRVLRAFDDARRGIDGGRPL